MAPLIDKSYPNTWLMAFGMLKTLGIGPELIMEIARSYSFAD
jgi:hypothetical protein